MTDHQRGDTRADGYRFIGFEKRDGRLRQKWASPDRWERLKEDQAEWFRQWQERKKQQRTQEKQP
jgi:hypothetical protein